MFCRSWFPVFCAPRLASSPVCPTFTSLHSWYTPGTSNSNASLADLSIRAVFLFWCVYRSDIVWFFRSLPTSLLMVWRNSIIFHNNTFLHLPYFSKLVSHTSSFLMIGNCHLECSHSSQVHTAQTVTTLKSKVSFSGISKVTSRHQLLGLNNSLFSKRWAIILRTPDARCRIGHSETLGITFLSIRSGGERVWTPQHNKGKR